MIVILGLHNPVEGNGEKLNTRNQNYWLTALVGSSLVLVCAVIALINLGMIADESHLANVPSTPLWLMLWTGLLGLIITLPGWLAQRKVA